MVRASSIPINHILISFRFYLYLRSLPILSVSQALLTLTTVNTDRGKDIAAHALAKIAITMNPEVAFPGQKVTNWRWL